MVDTNGEAQASPFYFWASRRFRASCVKRLIVNADDFGYTRDVNEGILQSHRHGIVRSASLMANGSALEHAVGLALRCPTLAIGCHLTLVEGPSVACPGTMLAPSLVPLLVKPPTREDVIGEFRAQVEKLLACGVRPDHLDTHKHLHIFPPVLEAVTEVAREFGIRWIRKPFDIPFGSVRAKRRWVATVLEPLRIAFDERLARAGCRTTDYFAGFSATGAVTVPWLVALLAELPRGTGELVCHPGYCGPELSVANTRLKESRLAELEALCDPAVLDAVSANGIELLAFRDLDLRAAKSKSLQGPLAIHR